MNLLNVVAEAAAEAPWCVLTGGGRPRPPPRFSRVRFSLLFLSGAARGQEERTPPRGTRQNQTRAERSVLLSLSILGPLLVNADPMNILIEIL